MGPFSAMDIGRTGAGFADYWMDQIAHNLANVNTIAPGDEEPFRQRLVVAQAIAESGSGAGMGTVAAALVEDASDPARVHDPAHPLADADGYVTMPVVDMAGQFSDLIVANRTYQMNLRTIETGREAYQAALRIGRP